MATKKLAEGLIQAVATGTFLYIAFVEIITPELNKPDLPPLLKVSNDLKVYAIRHVHTTHPRA